jgi:hypothetical protein
VWLLGDLGWAAHVAAIERSRAQSTTTDRKGAPHEGTARQDSASADDDDLLGG